MNPMSELLRLSGDICSSAAGGGTSCLSDPALLLASPENEQSWHELNQQSCFYDPKHHFCWYDLTTVLLL